MFNRIGEQARHKKQRYKMGQALPVLAANALLAEKRYVYYIEQVKQLAKLPDAHFQNFYQSVIYRFAEFVQMLPEQFNEPLGSLLTNGLVRGLNTLHLFVQQFTQSTPLERYALFTACVLRDICTPLLSHKIFVADKHDQTIQVWQPFCGPLTEVLDAVAYKVFPLAASYQRLNKVLRVTLARQVMGEDGFLWIASDLRLLGEWLEAFDDEDEEGSGRLVNIIRLYRRQGTGLIDGLPAIVIDILESPATEYGAQFYEWLINGLEDGSIAVNRSDAQVHVTENGVFLENPGIFKTFAELYHVPVNQFVVFTQFGNLIGVVSKGGGDYHHAQLFSDYPDAATANHRSGLSGLLGGGHTLREGILIADAKSVFIRGTPAVTTHAKAIGAVQSHVQLAEFNQIMKPNATMKNR